MGSRERILARRAQFVAAALAATTLGCERKEGPDIVAPAEGEKSKKDAGQRPVAPHPCLDVEPVDGGITASPCLTISAPHDAGPPPVPCLTPKIAPALDAGSAPAPCLDVPPP
ncbi:MAG: hypothetical protein JNL79_18105 [Myxococcales bacterium]|nr:hypothetical protein [Myxococcales bacterium]